MNINSFESYKSHSLHDSPEGDLSISPGQRPGLYAYWPFRPLLLKKFTEQHYYFIALAGVKFSRRQGKFYRANALILPRKRLCEKLNLL